MLERLVSKRVSSAFIFACKAWLKTLTGCDEFVIERGPLPVEFACDDVDASERRYGICKSAADAHFGKAGHERKTGGPALDAVGLPTAI